MLRIPIFSSLFFILALFHICNGAAFSNKIVPFELQWYDTSYAVNLGYGKQVESLWFEEASFEDGMPVFRYQIEVSNNVNTVSLANIKYDTLPKHLTNLVSVPGVVQPEFKMKYHISKSARQSFLNIELLPLRRDIENDAYHRLQAFEVKIEFGNNLKAMNIGSALSYPTASKLGTGTWYKFKVASTGMYRLSYDDLLDMGFSNLNNVGVYGLEGGLLTEVPSSDVNTDLLPIPVKYYKGSDGVFNTGDYVVFYLKGPISWKWDSGQNSFEHTRHYYSDYAFYFLSDAGLPALVGNKSNDLGGVTNTVTQFNDYALHEVNAINLIQSGREWYGEIFAKSALIKTLDFEFPNLIKTEPVVLEGSLLSRSGKKSSFTLFANNSRLNAYEIRPIDVDYYLSIYGNTATVKESFTSSSDQIQVKLQYSNSDDDAEGYLDFLKINARRMLKFEGSQMAFRDIESVDSGNVSKFVVSNITASDEVWDVTDFYNIRKIEGNLTSGNFQFITKTDMLREFVVYKPNNLPKPIIEGDGIGKVENQNLHGEALVDYIIIYHKEFENQAKELAQQHRDKSNLSVLAVDQEQIFNEFSSGTRDVSALRNFIKMNYDRSGGMYPRYVLLFGDGSFDNTNMDDNNPNYILTYQSPQSISPTTTYVADDYYVLLDSGETVTQGKVDVGLGRFPVSDTLQAQVMVDKVKAYMDNTAFGDWRNNLCFIGDDEDSRVSIEHMFQANQLAEQIAQTDFWVNENKIFVDSYEKITTSNGARYPEVNKAIFNQMQKGALIVNYTGHGAEYGLAHEQIMTKDDINDWDNWGKFPVFMTATCEFARFDFVDVDEQGQYMPVNTTGEYVVLYEKGGGVASFTTNRVVYGGPNFQLNQNFYKSIFEFNTEFNEKNRLGDVFKYTKVATDTDAKNKRKFSLLGDPALMIAKPENNIVIDSINGVDISTYSMYDKLCSAYNIVRDSCEMNGTFCYEADSIFNLIEEKCAGIDTIGALSFVTISGHVEKDSGNVFNDFNGTLSATIFDKSQNITSLDNNKHDLVLNYKLQNQVIFKGKASVDNGLFTINFIVPKDIAYITGHGKISCYAYNENTDATGYDTSLVIGGFSNNSIDDNLGPEIEMFMNNLYYKENGITDESPILIAQLEDESGISTTTTGIGHEMIAVIDNNFAQPIVMNDFYESELNSYKKGTISYPMLNIEPGEHTLWIRVWDILNNSSEKTLDFVVKESNNLVLQNVYNYPNPVRTSTDFVIEHNLSGEWLEVTVRIYNLAGQIMKELYNEGEFNGYMSPVVSWDGRTDYGSYVKDGLYFYHVTVQSDKGVKEKSSKMLIVR